MFIFPVEFHDFVFIFLQLKYNIVFWYLNSDISFCWRENFIAWSSTRDEE